MNNLPVAALEAVLFAAGEPVSLEKLAQICAVTKPEALETIQLLKTRCDKQNSGLMLLELNQSYQIATKTALAPYVKEAIEAKRQSPLSPAAMEVLALIAYNQPVSKHFVEQVRGVDSSSVVNTLVDKGLLEEAGRLDFPGKPIAYRTTENFLRCFGLKNLKELPSLPGENEQLEFTEGEETPDFLIPSETAEIEDDL
jgi:segregation and condensation protein B